MSVSIIQFNHRAKFTLLPHYYMEGQLLMRTIAMYIYIYKKFFKKNSLNELYLITIFLTCTDSEWLLSACLIFTFDLHCDVWEPVPFSLPLTHPVAGHVCAFMSCTIQCFALLSLYYQFFCQSRIYIFLYIREISQSCQIPLHTMYICLHFTSPLAHF